MDFKIPMPDFVYEELIFVAVDDSGFMNSFVCECYQNQLDAIRLYCQAKLQSHPNNAIGLITMTASSCLAPTSDIDKITTFLRRGFMYSFDFKLDFIRGLSCSLGWISQPLFRAKQKKLLLCVGGPTNLRSSDVAASLGYTAKKLGVAVDVVNFCPEEKRLLEALVVAADNYGNSRIKHIQPGSSLPLLRKVLSSFPPIITRELMEQGEMAAAARNKIAQEKADILNRKGKNQVAAPAPPPKAPLGNEKVMLAKGKMVRLGVDTCPLLLC